MGQKLPGFSGKTIFVVGLGISGRAAVESFLLSGAKVKIWDDNHAHRVAMEKHYALRPCDINDTFSWQDVDALLPSPGIPDDHVAFLRANLFDCQILSDVDLLYQAAPQCNFIGITGTNGKSTTTFLVAHIMAQAGLEVIAGGNLGQPVLDLPLLSAGGYYVLELSSYQLHHVRYARFGQAALLNITPDHLKHHGSMENYINAKLRIFTHQAEDDLAIIGVSSETGLGIAGAMLAEQRKLSLFSGLVPVGNGIYRENNFLLEVQEGQPCVKIIDLNLLPHLPGRHNAENIAAAYIICRANNMSREDILTGLETFPGLAHRQEYLGACDNVHFINDSKATNVEATQMALLSYRNIYWIAGGKLKDENHRRLYDYIGNVKAGFFYGSGADRLHEIFAQSMVAMKTQTMQQAINAAYSQAIKDFADDQGDTDKANFATILLSPAAASFDQFDNFMHRGDVFVDAVEKLKNASG